MIQCMIMIKGYCVKARIRKMSLRIPQNYVYTFYAMKFTMKQYTNIDWG